MLNSVVISKYYETNSDLHHLSSLSKIINLLLFITSLFIINNIYIILIMFTFELIIVFTTNIPIKIFLKNILSMKYLLLFIIIVNYITNINYMETIIMIIKIIGTIIYTNIFILTTTHSDIISGLNLFFKPLNILGIKTQKLTLCIALAIRFIPMTMDEGIRIMKSLNSRGLDYENKLKNKLFSLKLMILPMFVQSIKRADRLSEMMELKLYNFNIKPKYIKHKWNILDIQFIIIHVIILLLALWEVYK